ncbi:MAG: GNAT family N-acetyltransferase [Coriobacteriia bacterium]|nr:GNAT family N-acetyltransferase [Coriobacteriia bacterium]
MLEDKVGQSLAIREARSDDLELINYYALQDNLGDFSEGDTAYVIVNEDDQVLGAIRLSFDEQKVAHVNPIVVNELWRGYGLGRELIAYVHKKYGELRLVARGSSVGFYEKLGFVPAHLDEIEPNVRAECVECPVVDTCKPMPMKLV